jgi:hypothetical protein
MLDAPGKPDAPVINENESEADDRIKPACDGFTMISSGAPITVGGVAESVTVTVKSNVPDWVGLPPIWPPVSVIPGGRKPVPFPKL